MMMTPILTNLTFGQRPLRPQPRPLPADEPLIAELTAIPHWRHYRVQELASGLHYRVRELAAALARLRQGGQLAPASAIGLIRLQRVQQLNALLAQPGRHPLTEVVTALYGRDTSPRRAQLKELICDAQADGLALPDLARLVLPALGRAVHSHRTLTYCQWHDLNPAHRARFIAMLRDLAPSPAPAKEIDHAA